MGKVKSPLQQLQPPNMTRQLVCLCVCVAVSAATTAGAKKQKSNRQKRLWPLTDWAAASATLSTLCPLYSRHALRFFIVTLRLCAKQQELPHNFLMVQEEGGRENIINELLENREKSNERKKWPLWQKRCCKEVDEGIRHLHVFCLRPNSALS